MGFPPSNAKSPFDDPEPDVLAPGTPWAAWSLEERRAFLGLFLDTVHVARGQGRQGGSKVWRGHERLRIGWASAVVRGS